MRHLLATASLLLSALLLGCATSDIPPGLASREPAPVVLVSIDGFRADYLSRGVTPNLQALAGGGVHVRTMRPSFPSLTFPNHYTLVTGLRPDHHGLAGNTMVDPEIPGVTFMLSNRDAVTDPRWWNDGEPLWVTAERQGVRTATMFWPGSEAAIHGVRPSDWKTFDDALPSEARVDQVLAWLARPAAERPRFVTLYFDDLDYAGHWYGPDDPRTTEAAAAIDRAIGRLRAGLEAQGMAGRVNLVIVSDHGMAPISEARTIRLADVVDLESVEVVTSGAHSGIAARPEHEAAVEAALLRPHPHMSCWRKADVPARFHYGSHRRVPPYLCLAETGWEIAAATPEHAGMGGAHGFDNQAPEMAALFVANGPAFRPGVTIDEIDNVDVYPMLVRLLGVTPQPNDGRPERLRAGLSATGDLGTP